MNINDIKDDENIPKNIWKAIWMKQWSVALKYQEIEKMGTLLQTTETNIDTRKGQKWLKDFSWRVTEELAEALEAKEFMKEALKNGEEGVAEQHKIHYIEEVIDALHFITELCIIAGYDWDILSGNKFLDVRNYSEWQVVYLLGLMCNCLKNKPWKQSEMLTDRPKFKNYLRDAYEALITVLYGIGLTDAQIYNYYFKKNEVNKFRIRSKY